MTAARRVGLNVASLLGAYVVPRVFTVGAVVLAARVVGAEAFGAYGSAAAFAVILSLVATLGMQPLLVRDLARDPALAPRLLRAAHLVKTAACAVMLFGVFALGRWAVGLAGDALPAALLLGIAYAIGAYGENLSAYFQAVERMHVWTEASALYGLVAGGLGALLVWTTRSIVWFSAAAVAGQAVSLGWLLLRAPAPVRRGERATASDVARLVRALAPFAATYVILTLHYKLDVLLLERWRSAIDVGLYTAAYKFVDVFHALVVVGVSALYPRLARAAQGIAARDGERWAGTRATEVALLAAIPVGAALHLAARPAVAILFGSAYADATVAAALLALALPALALNILGGYVLGAAHRIGWMAALYGGALALKTALNATLIPRMGATGAAGAMAIAEVALAGGVLLALRRHAGVTVSSPVLAVAAGAAILGALGSLVDEPTGGVLVAAGYLVLVAALYSSAWVARGRRRAAGALEGQVAAEHP